MLSNVRAATLKALSGPKAWYGRRLDAMTRFTPGETSTKFAGLFSGSGQVWDGVSRLPQRMFIAQKTLEQWLDREDVEVEGNRVAFRRLGRTYRIQAAVRFREVASEQSSSALIGKVLTEAQIVDHGGELMNDSVLFGDVAFTVEPGYVGTLYEEAS
ncbi:MAG: hypothetical protein ACFB9M_08610 [Myxococcota bacterium]